MEQVPDGQYQKYTVSSGEFIRKDFFARDPEVLKLVANYSDEQLEKLRRGGHDPEKVYAAYHAAVNHKGQPTVILAQTIKGYGLGEAGEGRNITHQQKKLNEEELRKFRSRFGIPIDDDSVAQAPFYKPAEDSEEIKYLKERRAELGGYIPQRKVTVRGLKLPGDDLYEEFKRGTGERAVATTMSFVHLLSKLLADKEVGKYIVPIVPDEARTFGLEALFRKYGIYSSVGQKYDPVDKETLLYYKEAQDGQILEEGITEAGSMASFNAAATSYSTHGLTMIPFFIFYSMFGFQRIGDMIWAAGDMRARGFILGATSGRTTLAGEGLQHQDGNSHLLALPVPNLKAYDPAFAYELALIIKDGMRRMYHKKEDILYYITVMNEFYQMPPMPDGVEEGILKGMYKYRESDNKRKKFKAHLFGSGAILNEVLKAQEMLENKYDVATDVWSVTSYKELYQDAITVARQNLLKAGKSDELPYVSELLKDEQGVFVAASDYVKAVPAAIAQWIPGPYSVLGTDGFGRSESRAALRDFFEVDAKHIVLAALTAMVNEGKVEAKLLKKAAKELEIRPDKPNPLTA
jgi:pyruvate dehydrogenase E1 component